MSELIDNRAHRLRTLKGIIRGLHEGESPGQVKSRLKVLVSECDASEIASMEQELMAEGVPASEIMGMCDLHAQVVRDILVETPVQLIGPGHPVDTFKRENAALRKQAAEFREALSALVGRPEAGAPAIQILEACRRLYGGLMDVEKHYQRKEHLLFPFLEKNIINQGLCQ